jgi:hypothetical protein
MPRQVRSARVLGYALTAVVCLTSCESTTEPDPVTEGPIVEVRSNPLTILVEPEVPDCGYWFLVDSGTDVRRLVTGNSTTPASATDLRVGERVRVCAYSGGSRPTIPVQAGHPFRWIPATHSGASRPPIPVMPAGHSGRFRPPCS